MERVFVLLTANHGKSQNTYHIGRSYIFCLESAIFIRTLVWVAVFGVDAIVLLDVFEGIVHQTSIAPVVSEFRRTVDQILFREGDEFLRLGKRLTLQ